MKDEIIDYHQNVDKSLVIRQALYFVIVAVLLVINVLNVIKGDIGAVLAASGFILATVIGLLLSRMFKIFWHHEKEKVVSRLDAVGMVLLAVYVGIEIGRNWFFGYWLSGAALASFGLVVLSGLLAGRFLGTFIKIQQALER